MKKQKINLIMIALSALIIFLLFSAWIVSLTGIVWLSLVRDFLVFIIILFAIFNLKKVKVENKWPLIITIIFISWALSSAIWRQSDFSQWLRGLRYLVIPILLFLTLSILNIEQNKKIFLTKTIIFSGLIIVIIGVAETLGIKIPFTTALSGMGVLDSLHYVGSTHLVRIQSILSGPNALGLYSLALLTIILGFWTNSAGKYLLILPFLFLLIFSFSRSAWIGSAVALFFYVALNSKVILSKPIFWIAVTALIFLGVFTAHVQSSLVSQLITHNDSSAIRKTQYIRVWEERDKIGLLGRGVGAAGPSSQNRLDNGKNYWTENIYLDIFEQLGLVGLILYLLILFLILKNAWSHRFERIGQAALLFTIGFSVAGLFIDNYTGQIGIYLFWIINGLSSRKEMNV